MASEVIRDLAAMIAKHGDRGVLIGAWPNELYEVDAEEPVIAGSVEGTPVFVVESAGSAVYR